MLKSIAGLRGKVVVAALTIAAALGGCSAVGPGLKNHPGDCAIGIPWGDCLPGTAGYNNGGGTVHRQEAADRRAAQLNADAELRAQCDQDYQNAQLDPIRGKVEISRSDAEQAPPFAIATNDTFPTDVERAAIARWATARENCIKRFESAHPTPPDTAALQATLMRQDRSFFKEASTRVGDMIVALYQQKLTYGEFAKKRYEITRDAAAAQARFREAKLVADLDRQRQAQQLAQQQFQSNMLAWQAYTQALAARAPQTVHVDPISPAPIDCTSQRFGTTITTHCN